MQVQNKAKLKWGGGRGGRKFPLKNPATAKTAEKWDP